jgi:hypothetical protein
VELGHGGYRAVGGRANQRDDDGVAGIG